MEELGLPKEENQRALFTVGDLEKDPSAQPPVQELFEAGSISRFPEVDSIQCFRNVDDKVDINGPVDLNEEDGIHEKLNMLKTRNVFYMQFDPSHEFCSTCHSLIGSLTLDAKTKGKQFIGTEGVLIKDIQSSMEEEIAFDKEFQQLQKPSIKTIQNMFGDIYDCVDFYMQPAFDHPLLKNHTFHPEMTPVLIPEAEAVSCEPKVIDSMKLKDGGCPKETVPIRRTSKDDYIRIKRFTSDYAKYNSKGLTPGTHVAILQTNSDPQRTKYHGVGGELNVYNLSIDESQYSSGEFIVRNGADQIKVGWTINPKLNKDKRPHLFQYLDAGGSHCFNALCPGFVHTSKIIAVDAGIRGTSVRGGVQRFLPFLVFQDAKTGHWWLQVCGRNIGFWPKQIFSSMSTAASYIGVGGEVYGPPGRPLPPMGNGYYPVNDMFQSSYCMHLVVTDENHRSVNPQYTETYSDDWHYGIYDVGISGNNGRVIYYGGTTLW